MGVVTQPGRKIQQI